MCQYRVSWPLVLLGFDKDFTRKPVQSTADAQRSRKKPLQLVGDLRTETKKGEDGRRNRSPRSSSTLSGNEGYVSVSSVGSKSTLGSFIGVPNNFQLNFICSWTRVFNRAETAVMKIVFNGIKSTT